MLHYKNEDALTVDKSTIEPIISGGSAYSTIIL